MRPRIASAGDRENEADQRSAWSRGGRAAPADTWRWLPFEADWPLRLRLRLRGLVDEGSGATFGALERRELITCRYRRGTLGEVLDVRLPAGTLREWHWRALALAYASPEGLERDGDLPARYGGLGWPTWRRLRDHRGGALVEERTVGWRHPAYPGGVSAPVHRLFLTEAGRRFYEDHWAEYGRRYPTVAAPAPARASRATSS